MDREFWLYEAMDEAGLSHGNTQQMSEADEAWSNLEGEVLD